MKKFEARFSTRWGCFIFGKISIQMPKYKIESSMAIFSLTLYYTFYILPGVPDWVSNESPMTAFSISLKNRIKFYERN